MSDGHDLKPGIDIALTAAMRIAFPDPGRVSLEEAARGHVTFVAHFGIRRYQVWFEPMKPQIDGGGPSDVIVTWDGVWIRLYPSNLDGITDGLRYPELVDLEVVWDDTIESIARRIVRLREQADGISTLAEWRFDEAANLAFDKVHRNVRLHMQFDRAHGRIYDAMFGMRLYRLEISTHRLDDEGHNVVHEGHLLIELKAGNLDERIEQGVASAIDTECPLLASTAELARRVIRLRDLTDGSTPRI